MDSDPERWTSTDLYVVNKRVTWHDPETELPQEIVSGQYIVPTLNLIAVREDTRRDIRNLPAREETGRVVRNRYVAHNEAAIVGTRITARAIKRFAEAGYSIEQIRKEYPDLTPEDVKAALDYESSSAA